MSNDTGTGQVVVVGVDGSAESVAALSWAGRYAAATGASVRAVRAWHYPTTAGLAPEGRAPRPVTDEVEANVRNDLAEAVGRAQVGPSAQVDAEIVYGHPAQVLIDESARASLLVVGHKGHGGFTGMLTGSVSIHCVNHAACPVVVIRGD
jgi:nucleotide-binding universal stress UspA family protein